MVIRREEWKKGSARIFQNIKGMEGTTDPAADTLIRFSYCWLIQKKVSGLVANNSLNFSLHYDRLFIVFFYVEHL